MNRISQIRITYIYNNVYYYRFKDDYKTSWSYHDDGISDIFRKYKNSEKWYKTKTDIGSCGFPIIKEDEIDIPEIEIEYQKNNRKNKIKSLLLS